MSFKVKNNFAKWLCYHTSPVARCEACLHSFVAINTRTDQVENIRCVPHKRIVSADYSCADFKSPKR